MLVCQIVRVGRTEDPAELLRELGDAGAVFETQGQCLATAASFLGRRSNDVIDSGMLRELAAFELLALSTVVAPTLPRVAAAFLEAHHLASGTAAVAASAEDRATAREALSTIGERHTVAAGALILGAAALATENTPLERSAELWSQLYWDGVFLAKVMGTLDSAPLEAARKGFAALTRVLANEDIFVRCVKTLLDAVQYESAWLIAATAADVLPASQACWVMCAAVSKKSGLGDRRLAIETALALGPETELGKTAAKLLAELAR